MATPGPATPGTPAIVVIDLNPVNGKFSYGGAGNPVRVNRGDPIEWSCTVGNFAVHFDRSKGTPCPAVQYQGSPGGNAKAHILANAASGTYKYIVAVVGPTGIYIDDPEVIVP